MTTPTPLARKTYIKALLLGQIPPLPHDAELYCHFSEHHSQAFYGYMLYYYGRINGYRWEIGEWYGSTAVVGNKLSLLAYQKPAFRDS